MAVTTTWPYYRGDRKVGFHYKNNNNNSNSNINNNNNNTDNKLETATSSLYRNVPKVTIPWIR